MLSHLDVLSTEIIIIIVSYLKNVKDLLNTCDIFKFSNMDYYGVLKNTCSYLFPFKLIFYENFEYDYRSLFFSIAKENFNIFNLKSNNIPKYPLSEIITIFILDIGRFDLLLNNILFNEFYVKKWIDNNLENYLKFSIDLISVYHIYLKFDKVKNYMTFNNISIEEYSYCLDILNNGKFQGGLLYTMYPIEYTGIGCIGNNMIKTFLLNLYFP